jgi:hypothetical protein
VADWHPIRLAFRTGKNELTLIDPYKGYFGVIRRLEFNGEVWYRGVTWAEASSARVLVGYSRDLNAVAKLLYRRHLREPNERPGATYSGYPDLAAGPSGPVVPDRVRE